MRFLSFEIQKDEFGIQLEKVKEVIAFPQITPTPGMPSHCLGLMRLRDQVLPVVDLRIRLKLEPTLTHDTAIVVCDTGSSTLGVVVDAINTVIAPNPEEIMASPKVIDGNSLSFVTNIVRRDHGLMLILDVGLLLSSSEEELLKTQTMIDQMKAA